jgi:hypothetical protein
MSLTERYLAYADAFEESYADDDWSRIGQYFAEDAEYTGEPHARGRDAVLEKLQNAVNGFDRLMDSRTLDFEAPVESGNTVSVAWKVTYTKAGTPDLILLGEEVAEFDGNQIKSLTDNIDPEAETAMGEWMQEHGARLQGGG